jgi:starch phosphorylase
VQIYNGSLDVDRNITENTIENMKCIGSPREGICKYEGFIACDESGLFGYSIRILPQHPDMIDQFGLEMMRWIGDRTEKPVSTDESFGKKVGAAF